MKESIFIFSSPFILFFGLTMMSFSLYMSMMNLSIFVQWDFFKNIFKFSFPMFFDFMSFFFMGLVMVISSSILFYSHFYMMNDLSKSRFFFLMLLFMISMMLLILSPNFISMLLGWDGLGLVSYCLVVYYQNFKSYSAGMVTALTNRIGDVFILGTISLFFYNGSWSYMNFFGSCNMNKMVLIFFILSSFTKSAQIPFSAWLPAAMAAPTPVSSLVHSSTLVTAGIYVLIRFSKYLSQLKLDVVLLLFSLMTMIMAGISGINEYDLKKIIALSTLSQLGFMMCSIFVGLQNLTFFHLITHACFKALLFMCAGIFIHSFFDNQDIRCFGLLNKNFSLPLFMFNTANLSLCGFPFLSGFFSKDLILEMIIMSYFNLLLFFFIMMGTFLTVFYSIRLSYFLTFKYKFCLSNESELVKIGIKNSLFLLTLFSIFLGYFFCKFLLLPYNYIIMPKFLKFLIILICLMSFFICLLFFKLFHTMSKMKKKYILFFWDMWFLLFLKTDLFKKDFLKFGWMMNELTLMWTEYTLGLKMLGYYFVLSERFLLSTLGLFTIYLSLLYIFIFLIILLI